MYYDSYLGVCVRWTSSLGVLEGLEVGYRDGETVGQSLSGNAVGEQSGVTVEGLLLGESVSGGGGPALNANGEYAGDSNGLL